MNQREETKRDHSISFARMIAMLLIIACHFLQYYDNELAWWLNVGVQMFLFISGYLYADKKTDLRSQFLKILIPYYIFVLAACVVWTLFSAEANLMDVLSIITLRSYGNFIGLHHLWFISYILFAYLLTPLLIQICKCVERSDRFIFTGGGVFFDNDRAVSVF